MTLHLVICLINSYAPVKGDPVTVDAEEDEQIQVLLDRLATALGRPLVALSTLQTPSPAVEQLRQPRLYLNGQPLDLSHQFQDYHMVAHQTYTLLCDCRPCFPLLALCQCQQIGVDTSVHPPKPIIQLTTVAGQQAPYKYQYVKTLATAIYGKVKSCVKLHLQQDGSYAAAQPHEMFACKIMLKERMRFYNPQANIFSEDPLMELATQQFLGSCQGSPHPNVCGLVECCEDRHHIFSVMPFSNGGEVRKQRSQIFTTVESYCKTCTHCGDY